ncbi:MAG: ATP-binding protein [Cyanobacteria bacterium SBLK]|nr:ATP-binding protein [Cyanobacteria bacterium SBLK]
MNKWLVNPYTVGPPVMGDRFYGREKLLYRVVRSLQTTNVILLQGQRRIGKTSFLRQLASVLSDEQSEVPNLPQRIPVLFDIQRYIQDTLPQFQGHLADAIVRSIESLPVRSLEIPTLKDLEANSTFFQERWLPQVREHLGDPELVILVDEFDNFDEQISPHTQQSLIPFLGQLVSGESWVKWVFTLGRLSGKISLEYDPIVSSGEEFRLTFLSVEATKELIVRSAENLLTYNPESIEYIYKLTNGQPHLVQAVCSKIFEHLLEEEQQIVTIQSVEAVIPQTLEAYGSAIASIVSVPPVEEKVLIAIAQLTKSETSTNRSQIIKSLIKNRVSLQRDDLRNAIESLSKWGLLKGNMKILQISIKIVQLWLLKNRLVEPTKQEKLDLQYALAQSRIDFAEKALHAGRYKLAIKDYQESLDYIPNNIKALQGLEKAYRLNNEVFHLSRLEVLKKLYLCDKNHGSFVSLTQAVEQYIFLCEKKEDFQSAISQYDFFLRLQENDYWETKNFDRLLNEFSKQIRDLEEELKLYKYALKSPIDPKDKFKLIFVSDRIKKKYTFRIERYYIYRLEKSILNLTFIKNKLNNILKNGRKNGHDLYIEKLTSLEKKQWFLSQRVEIELSLFKNDFKQAISILKKLDKTDKKIDKKDEEIIFESILIKFIKIVNPTLNLLKTLVFFGSSTMYCLFLILLLNHWLINALNKLFFGGLVIMALIPLFVLWMVYYKLNLLKIIGLLGLSIMYCFALSFLVNNWLIHAFNALIICGLIMIATSPFFILWILMELLFEELMIVLERGILLIMKKFKFRILSLVTSD